MTATLDGLLVAALASVGSQTSAELGVGLKWNHLKIEQWLNFKLFGITYLVGKIKFKLFFQGPLAK